MLGFIKCKNSQFVWILFHEATFTRLPLYSSNKTCHREAPIPATGSIVAMGDGFEFVYVVIPFKAYPPKKENQKKRLDQRRIMGMMR